MDKTVTVLVERQVMHPVIGKVVSRTKKYHAHNEGNEAKLGDKVVIEECRPVSKTKAWKVAKRRRARPSGIARPVRSSAPAVGRERKNLLESSSFLLPARGFAGRKSSERAPGRPGGPPGRQPKPAAPNARATQRLLFDPLCHCGRSNKLARPGGRKPKTSRALPHGGRARRKTDPRLAGRLGRRVKLEREQ